MPAYLLGLTVFQDAAAKTAPYRLYRYDNKSLCCHETYSKHPPAFKPYFAEDIFFPAKQKTASTCLPLLFSIL